MNGREFGQEEFSDDQFLAGGVTLLLTGLIGFVGNMLVLIVTYRILRHRRNIPNILILFLAWIDLLVFPSAYPQSLIKYFFGFYIGDYMACDFQATTISFLFMLSILLVVLMSVDRLLALYKPFYYDKHMIYDREKVKITAIGFGCSVLTVSLLPAFGVSRNVLHFPGTFCLFEWGSVTIEGKALVYIFMSALASAMVLIVTCNLLIVVMALRLSNRRQNSINKPREDPEASNGRNIEHHHCVCGKMEVQFAKLSGAVAVSFVGCWSLFLLRVTLIQRGWSFDELIDFTAVRLASLHTVVNPWLYPLTRRKYRDAFWYLLTLFAYYVTCTLVARPGTTLDEIVGIQSEASQVRELYQEERRRSSSQRLVK